MMFTRILSLREGIEIHVEADADPTGIRGVFFVSHEEGSIGGFVNGRLRGVFVEFDKMGPGTKIL